MRVSHLSLMLLATLATGACSSWGDATPDGAMAANGEFVFRDPARTGCKRIRRTGTRIPRCVDDPGIYNKAYHVQGRDFDDRTGAPQH